MQRYSREYIGQAGQVHPTDTHPHTNSRIYVAEKMVNICLDTAIRNSLLLQTK
jgi:hypothetical protein